MAQFSSIALIEVDSELGAGKRGQSIGTRSLAKAAIEKQLALMNAENGVLSLDSLKVQTANWADALGNKHNYAKYINTLLTVLSNTSDLLAEQLEMGLFPTGNLHGMPLVIATATDNLSKQINDLDSDTIELWNLCKALGLANGANLSIEDLVYVAVRDTEEAEDHLIETQQNVASGDYLLAKVFSIHSHSISTK